MLNLKLKASQSTFASATPWRARWPWIKCAGLEFWGLKAAIVAIARSTRDAGYSRGEWAARARSLDQRQDTAAGDQHDDHDRGCSSSNSRAFQGGSVVSWLWVQARPLSALPPLDALFTHTIAPTRRKHDHINISRRRESINKPPRVSNLCVESQTRSSRFVV